MTDARRALRQQLRSTRRALSLSQQRQAEAAIVNPVLALLSALRRPTVALYLANDGEASTKTLARVLWQNGFTLTLPVIHPFTRKHLLFMRYVASTVMASNRYVIEEPALDVTSVVPLHAHGALLMPLVGFDKQANRLGMGGGFYDRTLASIRACAQRPRLIGIAHDCQYVETLPCASWDVPLDAIVTPTQVISV
jgi:5-formyltetrahydrofolate cyclo-ligase